MRSIYVEQRNWFDKAAGNSYFSARVFVDGKCVAVLPMQYGYGDAASYAALVALKEAGITPAEFEDRRPLWQLRDFGFTVHTAPQVWGPKKLCKEYGEGNI